MTDEALAKFLTRIDLQSSSYQRMNVLRELEAAVREACATVAERFTYGGEKYYTYEEKHFTKDIAQAIRIVNGPGVERK